MKEISAFLLALLLVGCGADPQAANSERSQAQLIVERVQPDGPVAIEGSVSFARIEEEDGSVVAEEGFAAPDHGTDAGTYGYPEKLELRLDPGTYTMVSYQRACDPSCDGLDPPDDRYTCRSRLEVQEGQVLTAEVTVIMSGCQIEVSTTSG